MIFYIFLNVLFGRTLMFGRTLLLAKNIMAHLLWIGMIDDQKRFMDKKNYNSVWPLIAKKNIYSCKQFFITSAVKLIVCK